MTSPLVVMVAVEALGVTFLTFLVTMVEASSNFLGGSKRVVLFCGEGIIGEKGGWRRITGGLLFETEYHGGNEIGINFLTSL